MEALDSNIRSSGIHSVLHPDNNDHTPTSSHPYSSSIMAATAVASPLPFPYPNEAPPRYEVSSAYAGRSSSLHGLISPPDSRRMSDKSNEPMSASSQRQSLPSIHEALGPKPAYSNAPSTAPAPAHELPFSTSQAVAAPSIPRSYAHSDHAPYASQLPPPLPRQRTPPQPLQTQSNAFPRPEVPSLSYPEASRHSSVTSLQAATTPSHNPYTPARYESSRYEPEARVQERPTNGYPNPPPPPPQSAYTYGSGPAPYAHSQPQPPQFSQPRYQARDPREVHEQWKGEKNDPNQPFRQGLKRNLDVYDFENNLAEINISSSALAEWSAHYNTIAQEQQRSVSVLPERMPTLDSVKDMRRYQDKIGSCLDNMTRIINEAQQQSERAIMEQRTQEHGVGRPNDYDDDVSMYGDDMKSHSFTSEGKKRRGRAAPPGRCHSCNRAETPEWRRGPDGARTLCNACGLHYAKLTRKNTQNKSSQGSNGTNLRPKSVGEVSPRPM